MDETTDREAYTGSCACGAVRYRVVGEPTVMNHCQCRQCQRGSGTGRGSHLTFAGATVEATGATSRWTVQGGGGTRKSRASCPNCGAPVFMTFPDMPDLFVISAASLDDPSRFKPQLVMWASAAPAWDPPDPALPRFERMPSR